MASSSIASSSSRSPNDRNTDNPFDDSHADQFNDSNAVPLQDLSHASQSTETPQSNADSRELRIIEDIRNGNQTCLSCLDTIRFTSGRFLWHCNSCHVVTHHQCALTWARASAGWKGWRCPQCSEFQQSKPKGKCWCGKGDPLHDHPTTPNACMTGICRSESKCPHGRKSFCEKSCHPGPCHYACGKCANDPLIPRDTNSILGRFHSRRSSWCTIIWYSMLFLFVFGAILAYTAIHISWHTQPYLYPQFREKYLVAETIILILVGGLYIGLMGHIFLPRIIGTATRFSKEVLYGAPRQANATVEHRRTLLCGAFMTCICVGIFIIPIIGIAGGPDIHWNNQMKNSCKGFGARVEMGTSYVKSNYTIRSLNASISDQTFYLAPIFEPQVDSDAPYQYFHRFSGSTASTANFAFDFDLDNWVYRLVKFDGPDERTKWLASGRKHHRDKLPIFDNVNQTEILNGTIEAKSGSHLYLPQANLVIQGILDTHRHCEMEPFIRVWDTQGSKRMEAGLMQTYWNWDGKSNRNIGMRTASFGHGRQRLDMCVKEDNYFAPRWTTVQENEEELQNKYQENAGVSDWSILPLGMIASARMKASELGRLDCAGVKDSTHSE